jgi:eukaryotic-like serine/threonine-protein kinase
MEDEERGIGAQGRVGNVLNGKYRIDRVLGIGGMASVYAATHLRNANRVALKILHPDLALNAGLRQRFLREGYAANSVEHSGTVRIHDDDVAEDGAVFLVMDLLHGETLEARWEQRRYRLAPREVLQLMYQLLDVLKAAHAKGIVHRDIKPENLFLTHEGALKVLDFGVARLLERSVSVTRSGGVLGTPAFMAPEQVLARTKEVDAQSDLWSVGATAFTLLSGRYVHEAETAEEVMVLTASRPARSLTSVSPDIPTPIVGVVDRALSLVKSERWRDAGAMQRAVAEAYKSAFGVHMPGIETSDDDKTTLMHSPAELPGSVEAHPFSSASSEPGQNESPARPPPVEPTVRMRPSTMAGVTATWPGKILRWALAQSSGNERWRMLILAGIGLVAATVGSLVVMIAVSRHPAATPSPPSMPVPDRTPTASPQTTESASALPIPAATIEPRAIAVESRPTPPRPAIAAPSAKPMAARPSTISSATPTASTARAQPSSTAPNCNPPYNLDATGTKKWKVECL